MHSHALLLYCVYTMCISSLWVWGPPSPKELSWELHVMSATFSLATKLPIMDRQGSVTRVWTPATLDEGPDPPSTSYLSLLNINFGLYTFSLHVFSPFLLPVWYNFTLISNHLPVLSSRVPSSSTVPPLFAAIKSVAKSTATDVRLPLLVSSLHISSI